MLQERRGMARLWNIALVIGAFALTTFGTFLTRANVVSSVHAFAQTSVGPAYLAFLALVLLVGFGLVAWRLPELRTPASLTSAISREGAFVANNVLLLAATAIILLGTTFPLVVEAVSGQQITVGGPYFRSSVTPVFLLILLLAGTAPLLPWRATNRARALRRLRVPATAAALVMIATAWAGVHQVAAVAGFGLATLVFVTSGQEILSGLAIGRHGTRGGAMRALARGRRRHAGLVVHMGLALAAAGVIASSSLAQQDQVTLKTGQSTVFAGPGTALPGPAHRPAATAHRAHGDGGGHESRRPHGRHARPADQPVPGHHLADRLAVDPPGDRLGPVRIGHLTAGQRRLGHLPLLPQPRRELAVVRRACDGARRRRCRVAGAAAPELRRQPGHRRDA